VPKGDVEWETLNATFLKKHPFEAPFFTYDVLRLMRMTPRRMPYANGVAVSFKADV